MVVLGHTLGEYDLHINKGIQKTDGLQYTQYSRVLARIQPQQNSHIHIIYPLTLIALYDVHTNNTQTVFAHSHPISQIKIPDSHDPPHLP